MWLGGRLRRSGVTLWDLKFQAQEAGHYSMGCGNLLKVSVSSMKVYQTTTMCPRCIPRAAVFAGVTEVKTRPPPRIQSGMNC